MPDDNNNLPNIPGPQAQNPMQDNPAVPPAVPTFPTETDFPPPPPVGVPEASDLPPIISPPPKKFGGKKIIATILGLLILVGALGTGVLLVKQQQDIREKAAAGDVCRSIGGQCVPDNYSCDGADDQIDCPPEKKCGRGDCTRPDCNSGNCYNDCICIGNTPSECRAACPTPTPNCNTGNCYNDCICNGNTPGECHAACPCNTGNCYNDCICNGNTHTECSAACRTPTPTPTQCTRVTDPRRVTGDTLTITSADINKCKAACPDGKVWVSKYRCNGINLPAGCQDNGTVLTWDAQVGNSFPVGTLTCGSVQIDAGCKNQANTYGSVAYLFKSASVACTSPTPTPRGTSTPTPTRTPTPTPTPTPGLVPQCLNIKAYDTNWIQLTAEDLNKLKAGDKVLFTVAGTPANKIDKARFKVNGTQRPEVTQKKSGTDEYYDEYTIPAGVTSFRVNAQLHHVTVGWF